MKQRKSNNTDFLISDLPKNRFELFCDILKNQWRTIIIIGLILLIVFLPIILVRYYNMLVLNDFLIASDEVSNDKLISLQMSYYLLCVVLLWFIGISFGGVARIYKKMTFNDGYFLGADYFKGLKENSKEFTIVFIIYGLINFILEILSLNFLLENSFMYYLFKLINYGLFIPLMFIVMSLCALYTDSILKKIRISFYLYIKHLPLCLLIAVIIELPLLLLTIPQTFIQLIVPIIYVLGYLPIAYLVSQIILYHIFDVEINRVSFPELVGKGMYKKEE